MNMVKKAVSVVAVLVSALALQAVVSAPAHAGGYGCSGNLVRSYPVPMKDMLDGSTYYISDVKVYYDAGSGWNCAVLAKRPSAFRYGKETPMFIQMFNSRWAEDRWKNNYDEDQGRFKYYAGPVRVYGKNLCLYIDASIGDHTGPGNDYNGKLRKSGVACG
ncbi:hypothetical protein CDO52_05645 [Nocardiopsis gilva YIM 90087]|uniref:Secreted protein n=1 Tax=Nocardiopsis gilva YIM 90087 TaxID=1235441 RepID=A0A223S2I1_9ACTN|nr:hypothetical protein [Nocardiopsis gilva]ASU82340.1 hypothetical protein CDO52_05645 [Nocardiopsis gilva YIM 90087]